MVCNCYQEVLFGKLTQPTAKIKNIVDKYFASVQILSSLTLCVCVYIYIYIYIFLNTFITLEHVDFI